MAKIHLHAKTVVPRHEVQTTEKANGEVITYYMDPAVMERYLAKYGNDTSKGKGNGKKGKSSPSGLS